MYIPKDKNSTSRVRVEHGRGGLGALGMRWADISSTVGMARLGEPYRGGQSEGGGGEKSPNEGGGSEHGDAEIVESES